MTSNRPYLIRAMYQWICDNAMTPYLLVDAQTPGVHVPPQAIKDGKIVLNIAPRAVAELDIGNEWIHFMARFSGVSHSVDVPVAAVQAVYAQESGQGMMLPQDGEASPPPSDPPPGGEQAPKRPNLRIVK